MANAARTVLIDAFPDSAFRHRGRDAVACIDVLLATTTLATAVAQGRRAFVAAGPEQMATLTGRLGNAVVMQGLDGGATSPAVLAESPSALVRNATDRRPLVLASAPGTELVANAWGVGAVVLACFRNLSATAAALSGYRRVALLLAGQGEELSCEDQMAAAWVAQRLLDLGFEAEDRRTGEIVRRWRGIAPSVIGWTNAAQKLRRAGRGEEVDFVIAHVDDLDQPCFCDGDEARSEPLGLLAASGGAGRAE